MIPNLIEEHAYGEIDPLLNALFQSIDRLSFLDPPYTTSQSLSTKGIGLRRINVVDLQSCKNLGGSTTLSDHQRTHAHQRIENI